MHQHSKVQLYIHLQGGRNVTADASELKIINDILETESPKWQELDWINGYLPTGVPFRWRNLVCQSPGCDERELACAVQGEANEWNYIFSQESDFVADMNEDSLFCESHTSEFG